MTKPPDWKETLDDLARRRRRTWAMGGQERLAKHHGTGKLDARATNRAPARPGDVP